MEQKTIKQNTRTFAEIAREIKQTWKNIYFLANASYWKGEDARRIKAELKSMIK